MDRIVVIGTTGSGKSTLGEKLVRRLGASFIDLDALHWEPNWTEAPDEVFRQRIAEAIQVERWVISGNYSVTRDLTWARADTIVWLDYSLPLVFSRLLRRTLHRVVTQEDLWGTGNHETWRKQFLSTDSLFVWMLKTHGKYRRSIDQILQQPEYAHLQVIRLRSSRETDRWFEALP